MFSASLARLTTHCAVHGVSQSPPRTLHRTERRRATVRSDPYPLLTTNPVFTSHSKASHLEQNSGDCRTNSTHPDRDSDLTSPCVSGLRRLAFLSGCCFIWDAAFRSVAFADVTATMLSTSDPLQSLSLSPELQGVISAFLLILFSEIGDKTFFVAFLLALQNSKAAVFTGTFGALGIMTLISVGLGQALHQIDELLPESVAQFPLDDVLAIGLLIWFGILTLQSARDAETNAAAEQAEAQEGVKGLVVGSGGLILSTFLLVFSAEWGDKSFLATTALSAASSPFGVTVGAIGGHFVATILAVLGGSFLSNYVSEKSVQVIGGSLFLVFALTTAVDLVNRVTA